MYLSGVENIVNAHLLSASLLPAASASTVSLLSHSLNNIQHLIQS